MEYQLNTGNFSISEVVFNMLFMWVRLKILILHGPGKIFGATEAYWECLQNPSKSQWITGCFYWLSLIFHIFNYNRKR